MADVGRTTRRHLVGAALAGAAGGRAAPVGAAPRTELVLVQQGIEARTPRLVANRRHVESLPFDGLAIHVPQSWSVMSGERFEPFADWYEHWLAPLEGLWRRPLASYLLAFVDDLGDLFDDGAWDVAIENWRDLARGAARAGFAGIFYDNEEYARPWHNFPEDYASPTESLAAYREQARLRGRQVMEAVVAEFPAVRLLVFHGPYVSEPKTPRRVVRDQVGDAAEHELLGPFFVGLVEGAGAAATVIDGGEVYQQRTAADFAASYAWRKRGIAAAETDCAFIPPALRDRWAEAVSVGFAVYNRSWPDPRRDVMTPAIMERTLGRALRRADDVVWYWTERDNWLVPGGMPAAWVEAVRAARRRA